jgi:hypothetical protein
MNKYTLKYHSYFDLPLNSYFSLLEDLKSDDTFSQSISLISCFYQIDKETVQSLSLSEFETLLSTCPNPVKSSQKIKLETWTGSKKTLTIATKDLEFSPDLTKFSLAQYIDFQMSLPKVETNPEYLLSTILIPKGYKYNESYDSTEHINWIRNNVSIGQSNQIINFFIKRYLYSINHTVSCSIMQNRIKQILKRGSTKAEQKAVIEAEKQIQQVIRSILTFA